MHEKTVKGENRGKKNATLPQGNAKTVKCSVELDIFSLEICIKPINRTPISVRQDYIQVPIWFLQLQKCPLNFHHEHKKFAVGKNDQNADYFFGVKRMSL